MRTKALTAVLAILLLGTAASAAVIKVPKDHESIQDAIHASLPGDTIVVGRGEWNENVRLSGRTNLTFIGKKARITGRNSGPILALQDSSHCTFSGFTFENNNDHGAHLVGCSDIEFLKCRFLVLGEDGLRADDCSEITVARCLFEECGEDGISLSGGLGATQTNGCRIEKCVFRGGGDDSVEINGSNNRFVKCKSLDCGDDAFVLIVQYQGGTAGVGTGNEFEKCVAKCPDHDGFHLGPLTGDNHLVKCKVLVDSDDGKGNRFEGCQAKSGDNTGFQVRPDARGNVFKGNKASKNRKFDLKDYAPSGDNEYDGTNRFKVIDE